MKTSAPIDRAAGYSRVAAEYYDPSRHPTVANLTESSSRLAARWLDLIEASEKNICDVGAGRSVVALWLEKQGSALGNLVLTDSSDEMLQHSARWCEAARLCAVAPADNLPLSDASQEIVTALLGDPFNDRGFWLEARRVLRAGGNLIFTTPSFEWASAYRYISGDDKSQAVFDLADGELVALPSWVMPKDDQLALAAEQGFEPIAVEDVSFASLRPPISPKLRVAEERGLPVVTGYLFARS